MLPRLHDRDEGTQTRAPLFGDRLLIGLGILLLAGPLLLGQRVDQAPAASVMVLGALIAGTAAAAAYGNPAAAAGGALVFGVGAILLLPPIGGFAGLLFNLAFLATATLMAARYFRRTWVRPNQ